MTDVFREIDEEVRRERYLKLWKRFAPLVIGIAVLIVAGTGAAIGWRDYQTTQRERDSAAFLTALALVRDGAGPTAVKEFGDLSARAGRGYATLAALQQAAVLGETDVPGAVSIYDRIAQSDADELLRGIAQLRAALLLVDGGEPQELYRRLGPLSAETNPWRYQARELKALVDLRTGKVSEARDGFKSLIDAADAPAGVRGRAAELLATLPDA